MAQERLERCYVCNKHNISSKTQLVPIQEVNESYERVVNSNVRYRFVIDSKSLQQLKRGNMSKPGFVSPLTDKNI